MADDRAKEKKKPPTLELDWATPELAPDKTFSTTLYAHLGGWWEGGIPSVVKFRIDNEDYDDPVQVQGRVAETPLLSLSAGEHKNIAVIAGTRKIRKLLVVPQLPKPKRPEEEELETTTLRTSLEEAKRRLESLTSRPPVEVEIDRQYQEGKHRLDIQVLDEKKRTTPAKITIKNSRTGAKVMSEDTDQSGHLIVPDITFSGRSASFDIFAVGREGTVVTRSVNLYTPAPHIEPPEFSDKELEGGLIRIALRAIRRCRADQAGRKEG